MFFLKAFVAVAVLAAIVFVYLSTRKKPAVATNTNAAPRSSASPSGTAVNSQPTPAAQPVGAASNTSTSPAPTAAAPAVTPTAVPAPSPVPTPVAVNTANLPIDPWAGKTVAQLEALYAAQVIKVNEFDAEREKKGFGGPTVTGDPHYVLAAIGTHISHAKHSPDGLSPPSGGYRAP
jgi:hypothetical protein